MKYLILVTLILLLGCNGSAENKLETIISDSVSAEPVVMNRSYDTNTKSIHVFVALCDNENQGIIPVSKNIGNGQNPNTNLYWGAAFGIKTFFKRSKEWKLIETRKLDSIKIVRLVFKHKTSEHYLIADAYDGRYIKQTTINFLNSSCGKTKDTLHVNGKIIGIEGNAKLCAYIGHDGLMDFELAQLFENTDNKTRDVIILACYSRHYFSPHLKKANVNPLIWTTGLIAPEAYTLHDAISIYIKKGNNQAIQNKAAAAYAKYQKCGLNAAKRLLKTGW